MDFVLGCNFLRRSVSAKRLERHRSFELDGKMRLLATCVSCLQGWILFALLAVASALLLSEVGQIVLLMGMISIVGMPLVVTLMLVPAFTVLLGVFLLLSTCFGAVPGVRGRHLILPLGISAALMAAVMTVYPYSYNQRVDAAMPLAIAEDVALNVANDPRFVVGIRDKREKCRQICMELVMASPDVQVVVGAFERIVDKGPARLPAKVSTWGLVANQTGRCPYVPTQASSSLRIALAQAELDGFCVGQVPTPEQIDVIFQNFKVPKNAPGQKGDDKRDELFVREGMQMRLAYRRTQGSRNKLSIPMLPYSTSNHGMELGLSLVPTVDPTPLQSPVPAFSHRALLQAALGKGLALPSPEAASLLSVDERRALQKRKDELNETLHQARHDAALVALQSGDPEQMSKGVETAYSYLRELGEDKATVADLPLFVALIAAPDPARAGAPRALYRAPPEVLMPVVDAVLDHVIAFADAPMDKKMKLRFKNILRLTFKLPAQHLAPSVERLDRMSATRLGRQIGADMVAETGLLGLTRAAALLAFLDGRIADGRAREGFDVAFRGLCLMGPDGTRFLNDVMQRVKELPKGHFGPNLHTAIPAMVVLGWDDNAIRKSLRFDGFSKARDRENAEYRLTKERERVAKNLAQAKKRGVEPTPRTKCR